MRLSSVDDRRVPGGRPAGFGTPKLQETLAEAQRSHLADMFDVFRTHRNFCARHRSHAARLVTASVVDLEGGVMEMVVIKNGLKADI